MASVTQQKYELRREVRQLVEIYLDTMSEKDAKAWSVNLAAVWSVRMTRKDLQVWVERLRRAVDDAKETA